MRTPIFSISRASLWLQLSEQVWSWISSRVRAQPRFCAVYEVLPLFGFQFSQCRPRKLSVPVPSDAFRDNREFYDEAARLRFKTNFTGPIVTIPDITSHSRKNKTNTLKLNKKKSKKKKVAQTFCHSVTCLITMAAPTPPARHPSSLTPGNSRQSGRVLVVSVGAGQSLIWAR